MSLLQKITTHQVESSHYTEQSHYREITTINDVYQLRNKHDRNSTGSAGQSNAQAHHLNGIEFSQVDEENLEDEGHEEPHDKNH